MTCIVGLTHEKKVYMGCDSWGGSTYGECRREPKVFQNGEYLIGYTSSFRMGQILQYNWHPPIRMKTYDVSTEKTIPLTWEGPEHDMGWMVGPVIDSIRLVLKERGFTTVKDNVETGGEFLIGYRSKLFHVHSDFQVYECIQDYDAIGCGEYHAKGCLLASLRLSRGLSEKIYADDHIKLALEAAQTFSSGVRSPWHIRTLEILEVKEHD